MSELTFKLPSHKVLIDSLRIKYGSKVAEQYKNAPIEWVAAVYPDLVKYGPYSSEILHLVHTVTVKESYISSCYDTYHSKTLPVQYWKDVAFLESALMKYRPLTPFWANVDDRLPKSFRFFSDKSGHNPLIKLWVHGAGLAISNRFWISQDEYDSLIQPLIINVGADEILHILNREPVK